MNLNQVYLKALEEKQGNSDFMNKIKANDLIVPPATSCLLQTIILFSYLGRGFYRGAARGGRGRGN